MNNITVLSDKKFKSMYISVNFLMPLIKKEASKNALLSLVLKQGCQKYNTEKELELELSRFYSSTIITNVEKQGSLYNIEIAAEVINKKYIEVDILNSVLDILYDIIFNPYLEKGAFSSKYVEREKTNLINKIDEEKNDKKKYAIRRIEEEVFSNEEYSTNVLGKEADILNITPEELYIHYKKVLSESEVKIIITGNTEGYDNIEEIINKRFTFNKQLVERKNYLVINGKVDKIKEKAEYEKLNQSILCLGARIQEYSDKDFYVASVYNTILGETPSSKLFQNVREKESLAYFCKSQYTRLASSIYIYSGIDISKVEKAKKLILNQLEDIKIGSFSDEEFLSAKKYIVSKYKTVMDSKITLSRLLLVNYILFGKNVPTIDEIVKGINNIEKSDITQFAKKVQVTNIYLLGGKNE